MKMYWMPRCEDVSIICNQLLTLASSGAAEEAQAGRGGARRGGRRIEANLYALWTIILPTYHGFDVVPGGGWVDTFMLKGEHFID